MSHGDGVCTLNALLADEDCTIAFDVELIARYFRTAGGEVSISSFEVNGAEVPLSKSDLEQLADYIKNI